MAVNMEVKVLTVFILLVNVLILIYYVRNTPRPAGKTDRIDALKRIVRENNIYIKAGVDWNIKTNAAEIDNSNIGALNKHIEYGEDLVLKNGEHDEGKDLPVNKGNNEKEGEQIKASLRDEKESEILGKFDDMNSDFRKVGPGVFVYSAYLDDRKGRYIRFIAVVNVKAICDLQCRFGQGLFVNATFYKTCESHDKPFAAYLISCQLPILVSRSYVKDNGVVVICNGLNKVHTHFKVTVAQSSSSIYKFTVCVPPLYGQIAQDKFIEFIEVTRNFGADHFTFYDHGVDDNVKMILKSYDKDLVEIRPWKHNYTDEVLWYKGQSASVWDCMLRNVYTSRYIAFNDIDEFIVPRMSDTWDGMLNILNRNGDQDIAGYRFKSVVFDNSNKQIQQTVSDEIKHLVTMTTVIRTKQGDMRRTKLIVNPRRVFELGIHHLSRPLEDRYVTVSVKMDIAVLHHYRKFERFPMKRKVGVKAQDRMLEDYTMWRFKTNITRAVNERLNLLKRKYLNLETKPNQSAIT